MKKFEKVLYQYGAVGFVAIVALVVLWLNKPNSGQMMIGWDNLQSEFNIGLNMKRSLAAVWQEYQGLGLLGGMAHAADLVRLLLIWPLSLVLKLENLRLVMIGVMYVFGGIGMYVLGKYLTNKLKWVNGEVMGLIGALFYLLNVGTVQNFYTPFEPFYWYFGFFPWLIWALIRYLDVGTKRYLLVLLLVNVLAAPMAYLQTAFVTYLLVAGIMLMGSLVAVMRRKKLRKVRVRRVVASLVVIFIAHAYWLLPVGYFTLTSADVTVEAKMNQLATPEVTYQNKAYGTLGNVLTLKGYWLGLMDADISGDFDYLMKPWRDHLDEPWVIGLVGLWLVAMIIGVVVSWWKRNVRLMSMSGAMFIGFMMLATNTSGVVQLQDWLGEIFPLFKQVFRSPFAKWIVPLSGLYAVFVGVGIGWLVVLMGKRLRKMKMDFVLVGIVVALVGLTVRPIFEGDLFYKNVKQELPEEYLQLFEFFEGQPKQTRIARFPVQTLWGWDYYSWGYRGSGFIWYGIEQPILDRAFDVWSPYNESFYLEFSRAVYNLEHVAMAKVLDKYDVTYVLIDRNVVLPGGDQEHLALTPIHDLLIANGSQVVFAAGELEVWRVVPETITEEVSGNDGRFVETPSSYTPISADTQNVIQDVVFQDWGNYISLTSESALEYPFVDIYQEEVSGVDYQLSEFGDSSLMIEREVDVDGNRELIIPGLVVGYQLSPQARIEFAGGEIRITIDQGVGVYADGQLINTTQLVPNLILPVEGEMSEVMVSIADEELVISEGEVMSVVLKNIRVGQEIAVSVYDITNPVEIDLSPGLGKEDFYECWIREGYEPYVDQKSDGGEVIISVKNASACSSHKLMLDEVDEGIVRITLPHKSDSKAKPHFCVVTEGAGNYLCLHNDVFSNSQSSNEWSEVERYTPIAVNAVYWIDVIARSSDDTENVWTISYKRPEITFYPLISTEEVPLSSWDKMGRQQRIKLPDGTVLIGLKMGVNGNVYSWMNSGEIAELNCDVLGRGLVEKKPFRARGVTYQARDDATLCDAISVRDQRALQEHLVRFTGENVLSRNSKFYIKSALSGRAHLEAISRDGTFDHTYSIPSWPNLGDSGYRFTAESRSYNRIFSQVHVLPVEIYTLPLGWLARIRIEDPLAKFPEAANNILIVDGVQLSYASYSVVLEGRQGDYAGLLQLNQGYDEGWSAYVISGNDKLHVPNIKLLLPWFFGESLEQVKVNGWANGFLIEDQESSQESVDSSRQIAIVFWPQYLQWLGFGLLLGALGFLGFRAVRKKTH